LVLFQLSKYIMLVRIAPAYLTLSKTFDSAVVRCGSAQFFVSASLH
jgi:hypothetical protein